MRGIFPLLLIFGGLCPFAGELRATNHATAFTPPAKDAQKFQRFVRVQAGDTLALLAQRHRTSLEDIIRFNRLRTPFHIFEGQLLRLPPTQRRLVMAGERSRTAFAQSSVRHKPAASSPNPPMLTPIKKPKSASPVKQPTFTGKAFPTIDVLSKPSQKPTRTQRPLENPDKPIAFGWPLKGSILSPFGKKEKGLQNDGINIKASRGSGIHAAESGEVTYAGNELRGFGNLILIKHRQGWVSAYAHAQRSLVQQGDRVWKGQKIAEVGQTGNVSSPQLHFQLRKGTQPVDPSPHLSRIR